MGSYCEMFVNTVEFKGMVTVNLGAISPEIYFSISNKKIPPSSIQTQH